MKRFKISIILTLVLIINLMFTGIIYANTGSDIKLIDKAKSDGIFEINEFDFVITLQEMDDYELEEQGYSESEIQEIRNFDFKEELRKRYTENSIEDLKKQGYSINQDDISKALDGDPDAMRRLSSTLRYNMFRGNAGYSSNFSYLDVWVEWEWSTMPLFTHTDIIAFTWSKDYSSSDASYSKVFYQYMGDRKDTKKYGINGKSPGKGCDFQIPLTHPNNSNWVGKSGEVYLSLYDRSEIKNAEVAMKYAHKLFTGQLSVTYPGGLSIRFEGRHEIVADDWINY